MNESHPGQLSLLPDEPLAITFGEIEVAALAHEEIPIEATPALVASVKRLGVLEPVIVRAAGPDRPLTVVAGRRRLDAARRAGLATIPVGIITADDRVADVVTLSENALRRANAITEYRAVKRLVDRGASEREIAQATGMARGTIAKRLELLRLAPPLAEAFAAGKMAPSVAEGAAKLPGPMQAKLLDPLRDHGRLTAKDVRDVRTVRRAEAAATLPDALFDTDAYNPATTEEPVEATLAREIQEIIGRLPGHPNAQGTVRQSLAYAAAILADIATGSYEPLTLGGLGGIPIVVDPTMPPHTMKLVGDKEEIVLANIGLPPYEGGPLHNPGPPGPVHYPLEGSADTSDEVDESALGRGYGE